MYFDLHLVAGREEFLDGLEAGGASCEEGSGEDCHHHRLLALIGAAAERDAVEAGDRRLEFCHECRIGGLVEGHDATVSELVPALADVRGVTAVPEANRLIDFLGSIAFVHRGV